jgi:hypothetical protein
VEDYHWKLDDISGAADLLIKTLFEGETYRRFAETALLRFRIKFDSAQLVKRWLHPIIQHHVHDMLVLTLSLHY